MAFNYVQSAGTRLAGSTSISQAFDSDNTAGNLLIAAISSDGETTSTISDSQHNIWENAGIDVVFAGISFRLWYCLSCAQGPNTVTFVQNSAAAENDPFVAEYSPTNPVSFSDGANASGSLAAVSVGPINSSVTDLIIALFYTPANVGPLTPGSGYTLRVNGVSGLIALEDVLSSSGGSQTATGTFSANGTWLGAVLSFDDVPAPPPPSAWSQPDCRDYGNFPNDAVDIQGTLTYTVPSVDSRAAGAPVDSRAAGAPEDCRVAPNIPENSRNPPPF